MSVLPLAASSGDHLLAAVLFDLAIVTGCALLLGIAARRVGQAVVIGEIVAGLMLGPSLLGLLPGDLPALLFPESARPMLSVVAQIALVLFMFGVGFELDLDRLKRAGRNTRRTVAGSLVVPAVAGVALAPALWAAHPAPGEAVGFVHFAAFIAIVLGVTAFPVLARLIAESRLRHDRLGPLALMTAASTDLVAWIALAAVIGTVAPGAASPAVQAGGLVAFMGVLVLLVRPLLRRALYGGWCAKHGPLGATLLILTMLALAAAVTTRLGLHPVFGAFALGVACPRDGACERVEAALTDGETDRPIEEAARLLSTAGLVLVPTYFIVTGLEIDITAIGTTGLVELVAVLVVGTLAKVAGVWWATRRESESARETLALGLLLNTKGLTEIVALDIGRKAGVIDDGLFTVLVLFALVSTAMVMPLLHALLWTRGAPARAGIEARHLAGRS